MLVRHRLLATLLLVALPAAASAQTISTADASASSKAYYGIVSGWISASADKMPDEHFTFKPTPEVRSFAQLLGHVADSQYQICAMALGEKAPETSVEKTRTTKAELKEALSAAFAYCNQAHATLAGPKGAELASGFGAKHPRVGFLYFNSMHAFEHYGNVITYLRLKGIVPPSSEPRKPTSNQ
jgi:uncharacterized damage-inducible protein DinB